MCQKCCRCSGKATTNRKVFLLIATEGVWDSCLFKNSCKRWNIENDRSNINDKYVQKKIWFKTTACGMGKTISPRVVGVHESNLYSLRWHKVLEALIPLIWKLIWLRSILELENIRLFSSRQGEHLLLPNGVFCQREDYFELIKNKFNYLNSNST